MREHLGVERRPQIEIAAASQEQSAGIEQINRAIMQMDDVTQQNASLVEEAAAAAASLEDQAGKLVRSVGMFKLDSNHASAAASQSPTGRQSGSVTSIAGKARDPRHPRMEPKHQVQRRERLPQKVVTPIAVAGGEWEQF